MAVYLARLKPGDTDAGHEPAHGGHLTHGNPLNFSGKLYTMVPYGVRADDERIDYDQIAPAGPRAQAEADRAGASAYPRVIDFERIGAIAREVGRAGDADMAHIAGLVAAGCTPARCRTRTSSPRRRTRRCAGRAAAWCSARPSTRRSWTGLFPASRAAR